jgi:hypothetical protein
MLFLQTQVMELHLAQRLSNFGAQICSRTFFGRRERWAWSRLERAFVGSQSAGAVVRFDFVSGEQQVCKMSRRRGNVVAAVTEVWS